MAKKKHILHSTVPTVVVALIGAAAFGVFLHFYTGATDASVLGAQSGLWKSERTVLLDWLRGLYAKKSIPQTPASGFGSKMAPVATIDDATILQDINSVVSDDGGKSDFMILEQY